MDVRAKTGGGKTPGDRGRPRSGDGGGPSASLVVLAGGASRRLGGGHKAFLPVGGREVLERILSGAAGLCSEVVLVVDDVEAYGAALRRYGRRDVRVVRDRRPRLGPLAGFEAGLAAAREERAWVVACDLPFLVPAVGRTLLASLATAPGREGVARAAVPRIGGRLQPLCAAYDRAAGAAAGACLDADRRRTFDLLQELQVTAVPESDFAAAGDPARLFLNVNRREDLARARRLAADEPGAVPRSPGGEPGGPRQNIRRPAE